MTMFKRGDAVEILPEYQDKGDDQYHWVCVNDEEKGRIDISPSDINLRIPPVYTVQTNQIRPRMIVSN
jgi:hypothetical protein